MRPQCVDWLQPPLRGWLSSSCPFMAVSFGPFGVSFSFEREYALPANRRFLRIRPVRSHPECAAGNDDMSVYCWGRADDESVSTRLMRTSIASGLCTSGLSNCASGTMREQAQSSPPSRQADRGTISRATFAVFKAWVVILAQARCPPYFVRLTTRRAIDGLSRSGADAPRLHPRLHPLFGEPQRKADRC